MWKRTIKNRVGGIQSVHKSVDHRPDDKADGISYTVEYLREELADRVVEANKVGSSVEPWELRDFFETDSLGSALREVIIRMFDPATADCWLYMTAVDKEILAEMPWDTIRIVRELVQSGVNKRLDAQEKTIENQAKEIALYRQFIIAYHADDMFNEWIKKEGKCIY